MKPTPIQRIRRFNRAVTVEVGALDASYLGRGRPLGAEDYLAIAGSFHTVFIRYSPLP